MLLGRYGRVFYPFPDPIPEASMLDRDFWAWLEYRLSHEMQHEPGAQAQGLWCDGFLPESPAVDDPAGVIQGEAWIGVHPKRQERWTFQLRMDLAADAEALKAQTDRGAWWRVDAKAQQLWMDLRADRDG